VADRSQFWQNVDATKPDKLSRLSLRQLRNYQNYFLEVQTDYDPALPPHEAMVASERLTLLRSEIELKRGKRRNTETVQERRHKQQIRWMKIGAGVAVVGILITIFITLCHTSSPQAPPPASKLNTPTVEPSPLHAASTSIESSPVITPTPLAPVTFADVNRVLSDTSLTDLQKDEFRRKHQGKTRRVDSPSVFSFPSLGAPSRQ
jgi:hypothetical protein